MTTDRETWWQHKVDELRTENERLREEKRLNDTDLANWHAAQARVRKLEAENERLRAEVRLAWDDEDETKRANAAESSLAAAQAENERLQEELAHYGKTPCVAYTRLLEAERENRAAESRLATAVGYVKKIYPNMWECDEALRRILAYNLAEPEAPKTAEPTFVCAPGESGYCDGCPICQPTAPARTEDGDDLAGALACCRAWEPDARLIGNVRAYTLLKLLERVEAEQAVLDAMQTLTERYQRAERWPAWWPEWVAELRRAEDIDARLRSVGFTPEELRRLEKPAPQLRIVTEGESK
jgi:hypothetical protein